jgi:hypothetical protein
VGSPRWTRWSNDALLRVTRRFTPRQWSERWTGMYPECLARELARRLVAAESCLQTIERRLSEGQGSQPWCDRPISAAVVREEMARLREFPRG